MKPVIYPTQVPQVTSYRSIFFLRHHFVKLVDQGTMRYEAFLYQDVLWLQVPISLVRSVVIVQTHGKLNKDEQNLLNGHHFLVNLVRKTLMRQLLVRRVVIRFMSINGLLKCIMTPRLFFFFDQPLALPPHLPLQLLSWLVRIVGRCKTLPAAIGRN